MRRIDFIKASGGRWGIGLVSLCLLTQRGVCQQPGAILWKVPIGPIGNQQWSPLSSPAIAPDGTIYVGNASYWDPQQGSNVFAISAQGGTNWVFPTGGDVSSSPAIGSDGTVYVGSADGNLYSISPAGAENWTFQTGGGIRCSPALGADGTIYINSISNNLNQLYAVHPDGTIKWVTNVGTVGSYEPNGAAQFSSPAIGPDGVIYTGSFDPGVYAINSDGTAKWVFSLASVIATNQSFRTETYCSRAIGPDGTIYFGADNGRVYALNQDGSKKWEAGTGRFVESSPALSSGGVIYVGSADQYLYAFNSIGARKWAAPAGGIVSSSPALAADGTIYCASLSSLAAFDPSGSKLWTFTPSNAPATSYIFSSPAIGSDGTVYIAAGPFLWAIGGTAPPQQSSWPMFRREPIHTARSLQIGISAPTLLPGGAFGMTFNLETGLAYRVQASTNLSDWVDLTNFVSRSAAMPFIDPDAPALTRRFYKLASP